MNRVRNIVNGAASRRPDVNRRLSGENDGFDLKRETPIQKSHMAISRRK